MKRWPLRATRLDYARVLAWCARNDIDCYIEHVEEGWKKLHIPDMIDWYGRSRNTTRDQYLIHVATEDEHMLLTLAWSQFYISPSSERA